MCCYNVLTGDLKELWLWTNCVAIIRKKMSYQSNMKDLDSRLHTCRYQTVKIKKQFSIRQDFVANLIMYMYIVYCLRYMSEHSIDLDKSLLRINSKRRSMKARHWKEQFFSFMDQVESMFRHFSYMIEIYSIFIWWLQYVIYVTWRRSVRVILWSLFRIVFQSVILLSASLVRGTVPVCGG